MDRLLDAKMLSSKKTQLPGIIIIIKIIEFFILLRQLLPIQRHMPYKFFAVLKFGLMISCFISTILFRKWGEANDCFFAQRNICRFGFCHRNHLDWLHWTCEIPMFLSIPVIGFGVLCSMNCLAISVWEKDSMLLMIILPSSIITTIFPHFPLISLIVFLIMSFITFTLFRSVDFLVLLAASLGCGVISLISFFENRVSNQLIRVLADVAVLVPALLIIIFLK